jgi:hypothetical protein
MTELNPHLERMQAITRRHFLRDCKVGLGAIALSTVTGGRTFGAPTSFQAPPNPLLPKPAHFAPKAKRVIYLHMVGGPSQLDLFDYKPQLVKHHDQPCPAELLKGKRFAFTTGNPVLLGTTHKFGQKGQSGALVSDILPNIGAIADDLTFIKALYSDQFNHAPAELLLYTGSPQFGRPSMGAWVTYGLGTENQNLPGFVVLVSNGVNPSSGQQVWGSGFLPSVFQGVQCRSQGDPVLYVSNPRGMDPWMRRLSLDAIRDLNQQQAAEMGDPETLTRVAQYELAFRMQTSVPEVMDIAKESPQTLEAYGATPGASSFANNCLLARRLVEQDVRFVQLFDWGWDFHGTGANEDIRDGLRDKCRPMDKAVAALIRDLKERGLLDETLVIWGGEFGRTPFREGRTAKGKFMGRDHHPHAFTIFMAGGGLKPGISHGSTDDLGFYPAENPTHVHDLQATILHLLGLDHERLTFKFQGRNFRLTDVHGTVIRRILA